MRRDALLVLLSWFRAALAPLEASGVFGPAKEQEVGMPGDTQVGRAEAGILAASWHVGAAVIPSTLLSSAEPVQGLLVPCPLCPSAVPLVTCLGSCPSCDVLSPAALCPFSPSCICSSGSCCSQGSAAARVPPLRCAGSPGGAVLCAQAPCAAPAALPPATSLARCCTSCARYRHLRQSVGKEAELRWL